MTAVASSIVEQNFRMWLGQQHDIDVAAGTMLELMPHLESEILAIAEKFHQQSALNTVLTLATPESLQKAGAEAGWYVGPMPPSPSWDHLRVRLQESLPDDAVKDLDRSSTEVVALCANPSLQVKKKGLVVGYVQSGKTANYASVIAKAGDAGYRFVIVLAGLHNNLRRQTQIRLVSDLGSDNWFTLTTEDDDFGMEQKGAALFAGDQNVLAVVKKNGARLRRLIAWMKDCGGALDNKPILIIDDEADQATPNTADGDSPSVINRLIREVWGQVRRGTYIGYTATPFANVFMDPEDDDELYPSHFVRTLPMSPDYFGAERLFGRQALDDADFPDDGLDMVREIPANDADLLKVPLKEKEEWEAEVVPSLERAARWFVIATAIRRARGQRSHSSMLVHFTHFVAPHHAMANELSRWTQAERSRVGQGDTEAYRRIWEAEKSTVHNVGEPSRPLWGQIERQLMTVLNEMRVIVDNSSSSKEDRLDYGLEDDDGEPLLQTVIVVGGGTLSRGLTLEGLVVSYFIRSSNTYDTLLQMGRWFGYRPGYQDLPRLWMSDELQSDFRFLALVEEDLRREIERFVNQALSPKELGIKVRSHPGRLQITSRAKMQHVDKVQVSLSGQVQQTFILHETDEAVLRGNLQAARALVDAIGPERFLPVEGRGGGDQLLACDVTHSEVSEFLTRHRTHPKQETLNTELVLGWFASAAPDTIWNVAVISSSGAKKQVDLGLGRSLGAVVRRPLVDRPIGEGNIKTLISQPHRGIDISHEPQRDKDGKVDWREHRAKHAPKRALLLLYPIDGQSDAEQTLRTRRPMQAPAGLDLIGYAICFPTVEDENYSTNAEYFAVSPSDWAEDPEGADLEFIDTEGDAGGNL